MSAVLRREIARTLLPFAWLAVLVQLLLPIGAGQAMARAVQDPGGNPAICAVGDDTAPGPAHGRHRSSSD